MVLLFIISTYGGRPVLVAHYPDMEACKAAIVAARDSTGFVGGGSARFYCIPAPLQEVR